MLGACSVVLSWREGARTTARSGTSATTHDLAQGKLTVGKCPHLEGELSECSWDDKAAALGEDKPVKVRDHATDACRYGNVSPIATFGVLDAVGF